MGKPTSAAGQPERNEWGAPRPRVIILEAECAEDALTEDEDPSSESDDGGVNDETLEISFSQDVPRSSDWEPHLGWRGAKSAKPLSDSLVSTAAASAESSLASLGVGSSSG